MAKASFTLNVAGVPELLQTVRAEFARVLREEAESEVSVYTATRLREIAAAFEAGQRPGGR